MLTKWQHPAKSAMSSSNATIAANPTRKIDVHDAIQLITAVESAKDKIGKSNTSNLALMREKCSSDLKILGKMEGPCVICLEETITNPVVLDCSHIFCFKCLDEYQQSLHCSDAKSESKCPYCRGEMPDLRLQALERAMIYGEHISTLPIGSDERKKMSQLALSGLDAVQQLFSKLTKNMALPY